MTTLGYDRNPVAMTNTMSGRDPGLWTGGADAGAAELVGSVTNVIAQNGEGSGA
jgi:hypothetical protein